MSNSSSSGSSSALFGSECFQELHTITVFPRFKENANVKCGVMPYLALLPCVVLIVTLPYYARLAYQVGVLQVSHVCAAGFTGFLRPRNSCEERFRWQTCRQVRVQSKPIVSTVRSVLLKVNAGADFFLFYHNYQHDALS